MTEANRQILQTLIRKDLIKKNSIFVLDDGRLIFCNPEMAHSSCSGNSYKNPVRVSALTGDIEIYYKRFKEFDSKCRFLLLCWAYFRFNIRDCGFESGNFKADKKSAVEYKKAFKTKKGLVSGFMELFLYAQVPHNLERLNLIKQLVSKWQK